MCGIAAVRTRAPELAEGSPEGGLVPLLLESLERLQYRGYDSAGIAVAPPGASRLHVCRTVNGLAALRALTAATLPRNPMAGIAHTRWATHGTVCERNAHPHRDCTGRFAVVHNGILDNATELRAELSASGHALSGDSDSELIAHLVEDADQARTPLVESVRRSVQRLRGTWALVVLAAEGAGMVLAAQGSPLVVLSSDDVVYAASDCAALAGRGRTVQILEDGDLVDIGEQLRWFDAGGRPHPGRPGVSLDWRRDQTEVGSFQDFMEKEIAEQDELAEQQLIALAGPTGSGALWADLRLPPPQRLRFVGCGTSLHAAEVVAAVARREAGLPTETLVASEAGEWPTEEGTLTVAVSQSGETADVLRALDTTSGPVLALTNAAHSTLARRADAVLDCRAGPEIGVAATKTFVAQVLAGTCLALTLGHTYGQLDSSALKHRLDLLHTTPARLRRAHDLAAPIAQALIGDLLDASGFLFVSRANGVPYAREGALKLTELTYRWAEAYPAGELKHGPLALLEPGTPVVVFEAGPAERLAGSLAEMSARGARLIRIGADHEATFPVLGRTPLPCGPLEGVVAAQHLARALAIRLGRSADRPRNLAKSVTVD